MNGIQLESVQDVVDLGVMLSRSGKTSAHCSEKSTKGLRVVGHIFRAFRTRNREFLLKMFRVYVRPILEYNSPAWSPFLKKDARMIERVQRTFTRRIPGLRHYSYSERLRILNLKSLEQCRLENDLVLAFRMLKGGIELRFEDFFTKSTVTRTRGHSEKLVIPGDHLEPVRNFFSNRGPAIWNSLPQHVIDSPSVNVFKKRLGDVDLTRFLDILHWT